MLAFDNRIWIEEEMMSTKSATLGFNCESLEPRRMLAGNVSVRVTGGGDLIINGDNEGNEIGLVETSQPNEIRVVGLGGTTINGQAEARFSGVDDDLRINLRNGDNSLLLLKLGSDPSPFPAIDDVRFRSGSGEDIFAFGAPIDGKLTLNTGDGNDTVVTEFTTSDGVRIRTGDGDDMVRLSQTLSTNRIDVNVGSGDDVVTLSRIDSTRTSKVKMGRGNDVFGTVSSGPVESNGNDGIDKLNFATSQASDLRDRNFEDPTEFASEFDLRMSLYEIYSDSTGGMRVDKTLDDMLTILFP